MFKKPQILKYSIIFSLSLLLSGCVSIQNDTENKSHISGAESNAKNHEYMVFIADLVWVKLYQKETPEAVKNSEGLLEVTVSTGCGKAEIQYKTQNGELITAWMEMGEWCKNPFDYRFNRQLIVVDSDENMLEEYYPIEKTDGNNEVIYFLELYQFETSIFRDLVKQFYEPLYLFSESRANEAWIEIMTEEGLIENKDHKINALKGVYISDVIDRYHLKQE